MSQFDYENFPNAMNDTAKEIYSSAMEEEQTEKGKGLHMYKTPHLWEEENPISIKDSPTNNFVPTPTMSTGDEFSSYKTWKKIAIIAGTVVVAAVLLACAVSFFGDYVF